MKPGLEPGRFEEVRIHVTEAMCPHFDGILVHPVLATWEAVHYMEVAGRRVLAPHLEPHEEGVGAHVTIDHVAPAPLGAEVLIRAEFESLESGRLTCRTTAHSAGRLLATGRFVQAVITKHKLSALLERIRQAPLASPGSAGPA
jgi:predicted thioesterase